MNAKEFAEKHAGKMAFGVIKGETITGRIVAYDDCEVLIEQAGRALLSSHYWIAVVPDARHGKLFSPSELHLVDDAPNPAQVREVLLGYHKNQLGEGVPIYGLAVTPEPYPKHVDFKPGLTDAAERRFNQLTALTTAANAVLAHLHDVAPYLRNERVMSRKHAEISKLLATAIRDGEAK